MAQERRQERTFEPAEIEARLKDLPHWRYVGGALERKIATANFKATLMVVMTVGHLCEAAWHHPDLLVGYNSVTVRLSTHSAKGITEKDFALAAKIEEVVLWNPAAEGGALTGVPDDPRYAYVRHE